MAAKKKDKKSTARKSRKSKPRGMAHKGSKCTSYQTVYSKVLGRKVKRCKKFS